MERSQVGVKGGLVDSLDREPEPSAPQATQAEKPENPSQYCNGIFRCQHNLRYPDISGGVCNYFRAIDGHCQYQQKP